MRIGIIFLGAALIACSAGSAFAQPKRVWAVDFVKTKDGRQADFLDFIEQNWARARAFMKEKGIADSYRVLSVPQSRNADWDVLLITEYVSQAGYERAEEIFQEYLKTRRPNLNGPQKEINPREISEIKFSREFDQPIASDTANAMLSAQTSDIELAGARAPLENYLKGYKTGNPAFMRKAFHAEVKIVSVLDGKYMSRGIADYIAGMSRKPADDEVARERRIEKVEVAGDTAAATIGLEHPNGRITEYLLLLKIAGEWRIVSMSVQGAMKHGAQIE